MPDFISPRGERVAVDFGFMVLSPSSVHVRNYIFSENISFGRNYTYKTIPISGAFISYRQTAFNTP